MSVDTVRALNNTKKPSLTYLTLIKFGVHILVETEAQNRHFMAIIYMQNRVASFFLVHDTKTGKNVPNEHTMFQMGLKYPKRP
jgi:hypothetical protein